MASNAHAALIAALPEVSALQQANPTPYGAAPIRPQVTRAIGRASVVLLSSHFERYIRSLNIESVDFVNGQNIFGSALSRELRLLHAKQAVEDLAQTAWEHQSRANKLTDFSANEAWLWLQASSGILQHGRLIAWMKSPKPDELVKYFKYWGISNIFEAITRTSHTKAYFYLKITELVDKRNNIAHGDLSTQATQADVSSYIDTVQKFCTRVDGRMAARLAQLCATQKPW
jgi:hypothetical protein